LVGRAGLSLCRGRLAPDGRRSSSCTTSAPPLHDVSRLRRRPSTSSRRRPRALTTADRGRAAATSRGRLSPDIPWSEVPGPGASRARASVRCPASRFPERGAGRCPRGARPPVLGSPAAPPPAPDALATCASYA
jgi:hypothetical protein